jgi:hypothetical protein
VLERFADPRSLAVGAAGLTRLITTVSGHQQGRARAAQWRAEPGLWVPRIGEVRFEDLLLVSEDGCQTLTCYPYSLTP